MRSWSVNNLHASVIARHADSKIAHSLMRPRRRGGRIKLSRALIFRFKAAGAHLQPDKFCTRIEMFIQNSRRMTRWRRAGPAIGKKRTRDEIRGRTQQRLRVSVLSVSLSGEDGPAADHQTGAHPDQAEDRLFAGTPGEDREAAEGRDR